MHLSVGIDTSTRLLAIGALTKDLTARHQTYKLTGKAIQQNMLGAFNAMCSWLEEQRIEGHSLNIFIEEPIYVNNNKVHQALTCIYASVIQACFSFNLFPDTVHVSAWKKLAVGSGNANKLEVKEKAIEVLGLDEGLVQDVYDAYCIALYGWEVIGG